MYPLSLLFEVSAPFGPGECPLGVGVEVFFSGKSGPTAGLYEENADKMGYTQARARSSRCSAHPRA